MNRRELVRIMADKLSVTQTEAMRFALAWEEIIAKALVEEGSVGLSGFGILTAWEQVERMGRNPRNGEQCMIHPRTSVKFKPGKFLLENLNVNPEK